jgi:hypothetical protein
MTVQTKELTELAQKMTTAFTSRSGKLVVERPGKASLQGLGDFGGRSLATCCRQISQDESRWPPNPGDFNMKAFSLALLAASAIGAVSIGSASAMPFANPSLAQSGRDAMLLECRG